MTRPRIGQLKPVRVLAPSGLQGFDGLENGSGYGIYRGRGEGAGLGDGRMWLGDRWSSFDPGKGDK